MKNIILILIFSVTFTSCRATSNNPDVIHGVTWIPTISEYDWLGDRITGFVTECGAINGKRIAIFPVTQHTENLNFNTKGCVSKLRGRLMEQGAFVVDDLKMDTYRISIQVSAHSNKTNIREDEYRIISTADLKYLDSHGKALLARSYIIDSIAFGQDRPR